MEYTSSLRNRKTCCFLMYKLICKWSCLYITLFSYKNNFTRTKALVLVKKIKSKLRKIQACCAAEHKNKVSRLAIHKIISREHQNRAFLSPTLYCMYTSSTHFNITKLFRDHILLFFLTIQWTVKFHFPLA